MPLWLTSEARIELEQAIEEGKCEKVEAFLKRGLNANALVEGSKDPLWWKSLRTPARTATMTDLFLRYGANASHEDDDGFSALHALIDIDGLGNPEEEDAIVQLLVNNGAPLEGIYLFYGWTPLMHAVMRGSLSEVHALLKTGADANKKFPDNALPKFVPGLTLLMAAGARTSLLKLLLQYNADPDLKNNSGETAVAFFERLITDAQEDFLKQDLRAQAQADVALKEQSYRQMDEDFEKEFGKEMATEAKKLRLIDMQENTVEYREWEILQAHELYVQDLKDSIQILNSLQSVN